MNQSNPSEQTGRFNSPLFFSGLLAVFAWVTYAMYQVFMVVPNEVTMGPVQRIFYFHVGAAFATYAAAFCVLIGSLGFLALGRAAFDTLQLAAAEVGALFCSIVLVTGMIWAQSAWNIPFSFREPRLVSTLVLWLLLVAVVGLRKFTPPEEAPRFCAVFGLLGAVMVPVVVYSVKFLSPVGQLHPVVVEHGGLREETFRFAFWISNGALVALALLLIYVRRQIATLENDFVEKSDAGS